MSRKKSMSMALDALLLRTALLKQRVADLQEKMAPKPVENKQKGKRTSKQSDLRPLKGSLEEELFDEPMELSTPMPASKKSPEPDTLKRSAPMSESHVPAKKPALSELFPALSQNAMDYYARLDKAVPQKEEHKKATYMFKQQLAKQQRDWEAYLEKLAQKSSEITGPPLLENGHSKMAIEKANPENVSENVPRSSEERDRLRKEAQRQRHEEAGMDLQQLAPKSSKINGPPLLENGHSKMTIKKANPENVSENVPLSAKERDRLRKEAQRQRHEEAKAEPLAQKSSVINGPPLLENGDSKVANEKTNAENESENVPLSAEERDRLRKEAQRQRHEEAKPASLKSQVDEDVAKINRWARNIRSGTDEFDQLFDMMQTHFPKGR